MRDESCSVSAKESCRLSLPIIFHLDLLAWDVIAMVLNPRLSLSQGGTVLLARVLPALVSAIGGRTHQRWSSLLTSHELVTFIHHP